MGLVRASEFAQFLVASFRALAGAGFGEQAAHLGKVFLGEPVGGGSEGADPQHLAHIRDRMARNRERKLRLPFGVAHAVRDYKCAHIQDRRKRREPRLVVML